MKQILLYISNKDINIESLYKFLEKEDVSYSILTDEDLKITVQSLLTNKNKHYVTSSAYPFTFILFSDYSKDEVLTFLSSSKKNGYSFSHKAMLTENNKNWLLKNLLQEINEENIFFTEWEKLQSLLKEANSLNAKEFDDTSYEHYKDCFLTAYVFYKNPKKEMIHEVVSSLQNARNNLKKIK